MCVLEEVGFNQILKRPIEVKKFWAQSWLMRLLQAAISRVQMWTLQKRAWHGLLVFDYWLDSWYNSCLGNTRRWDLGKTFGKLRVQGSGKEYHSKYLEAYLPSMHAPPDSSPRAWFSWVSDTLLPSRWRCCPDYVEHCQLGDLGWDLDQSQAIMRWVQITPFSYGFNKY